jgi:hypothetical protein
MAKKAPKPKNIGELQPGSTEWMNAFDALPAADQASVFNITNANPIDQGFQDFGSFDQNAAFGAPALAGTSYSPPIGTQDTSLDPMYQQLLQFGGGVNLPQLTTAGKLDPYDLSQEAQRVNLMQDNATSLADVILSSMAGPGAIDPSLFQPDVTMPTARLKTPGMTEAQRYSQRGGWQSYIANKILGGATDAEAVADLYDFISTPDSEHVSAADKAAKASITRDLPPFLPSGGGGVDAVTAAIGQQGKTPQEQARSKYDQIGIQKFASDLFGKVSNDLEAQGTGWQDPQSKLWYTEAPTQTPSYMTDYFHKRGLPTPVAQYTDADYQEQMRQAIDPTYQADIAQGTQDAADRQANIAKLAATSNQASDFNTQLQHLMSQPDYAPTPAGIQSGKPFQAMNTVTQYAAPGALTAQPPGPSGQPGAPTQLPQPGIVGAGGMMTQRPGAPGAPGRPGISAQDVARNVGNNQISAALGALASHPNQPEIPGRNPAYTFQDALGRSQVAGSLQDAQQGVADANVGQAFQLFGPRKGIGNQKPQRVTSQTTTKAQQQSDAARRAYENAYGANFAQTNRVLNPGRAALINAGDAGRQAVAQGRSPFVDAMIQRLLGQRAVGVRGL